MCVCVSVCVYVCECMCVCVCVCVCVKGGGGLIAELVSLNVYAKSDFVLLDITFTLLLMLGVHDATCATAYPSRVGLYMGDAF